MGFLSRKQRLTESNPPSEPRPAPRRRNPSAAADDSRTDPGDVLKRRARRRLVGAIALAVGAIVFVPMLFDNEAPPAADQLSVQIPGRDTPFEPAPKPDVAPVSNALTATPGAAAPDTVTAANAGPAGSGVAAGALTPAPMPAPTLQTAPSAQSPPGPSGPPAAPAAPGASATAPAATNLPAPAKALAAAKKSGEAASSTPGAPPARTSGPDVDDPRALAALEGKTLDPTPVMARPGVAATGFAIQVGAFASPEKVQEVRDRLAAAGVKSYTENLSTSQGARTRVRVGPFASHDAAEKALQRLKGAGLDGAVVPL